MLKYINPKGLTMSGYSADELLSRPFTEFIHPDDRAIVIERHNTRLAGQTPVPRYTFRIITKDGRTRWVEITAALIEWEGRPATFELFTDVTERRQAEDDLRIVNRRLSTLVQAIPEIVYFKDAEGKNLEVNRAYELLTGKSREELIGKTDYDILPGPLAEQCARSDEEAVRHGGPLKSDESFILEDGSEVFFETIKAPLFDDRGAFTGIIGVSRDITERKRAERELETSREKFQSVVNATKDGVIMIDDRGNISLWNEAAEKIFGYPSHEALGMDLHRLVAPGRYHADYGKGFQGFQSSGTGAAMGRTLELRALHKNGEEFPIEISLSPVRTENAWHAVGIVRDITERKKAEKSLRESEARYRFLTENMGDMAFIVDLNLKTTYVNPAAEKLLGYSPGERVLDNPRKQLTPESYSLVTKTLARELERDGRPGVDPDRLVTLVLEYYHKDGTTRFMETNCRALRNDKGEATGIYGLARDITERKKAEEERIAMERRTQQAQKLESLGVMAGGIAHDFNNLLAAILGNLDLAQLNLPGDSPALENIIESEKAARRAADLTRQILAYAGKGKFAMKPADMTEIISGMDDLISATVPRTASVRKDLMKPLPAIHADQSQVQQVIMNIVLNASEALGETTGTITISTGVMDCDEAFLGRSRTPEKPVPGRFVFLKVQDTGSGMDGRTLARVFEPFFTTKFLGRGLGMPAVLGIVGGHKGAVMMDSTPGKGTTVLALFPVAGGGVPDRRAKETAGPMTLPGAARGTILVVDDEDMVRDTCRAMLKHLGYSVITADCGREAIRLLSELEDEIAAVILDLTMPDLDGAATFTGLKRIRPDVKVILSSGYSEQEATRHFSDDDLAAYIQKPYQVKVLKDVLELVLKG